MRRIENDGVLLLGRADSRKWQVVGVVSLAALQRLTGDCFEAGAALILGL